MRNTVYKEGATNEQIAEAIACAMFVVAWSQLSLSDVYDRLLNNK